MSIQKIWFHGTRTKKNMNNILRHGFMEGTWFSRHMEDAAIFGGKYVFTVKISFSNDNRPNHMKWQVCCSNAVPPKAIERLHVVQVVKMAREGK